MSTVAHVGMGSGSYIQQVNGIYTEEIGRKGQVDTDPEPRMALDAVQKNQLAKYFEDSALLPDAKPAEQLTALTHRFSAMDSALKLLTSRLQDMRMSGGDESQIQELMEKIRNLTEQQASLASILNNPDKGALKKYLDEWYDQKKKEDAQKDEDDKTDYQKAYEKANKVSEATKGFVMVELDHSLIRNSFSMGMTNQVYVGINNTLIASANFTACLAVDKSYNLLGEMKVQTSGGMTIRAKKHQTVNMDVEERTIRNSIDKIGTADHLYTIKTDRVGISHTYSSGKVIQNIGQGGLDCEVAGDYVVTAKTVSGRFPKIAFQAANNRMLVNERSVVIACPAENGVEVSSAASKVSVKNSKILAESAEVELRPHGPLKLSGSNVSLGNNSTLVIKIG